MEKTNTVLNYGGARDVVASLSQSQGFYGRLLEQMDNWDEDTVEEFEQVLKTHNVCSPVDLILLFEC